jgi:hypothetical protein
MCGLNIFLPGIQHIFAAPEWRWGANGPASDGDSKLTDGASLAE